MKNIEEVSVGNTLDNLFNGLHYYLHDNIPPKAFEDKLDEIRQVILMERKDQKILINTFFEDRDKNYISKLEVRRILERLKFPDNDAHQFYNEHFINNRIDNLIKDL